MLGCTGDPCVVSYNPGGEIGAFKAAASEIKRTGRRVVIDGPCLSACAILADQARARVCVTGNAKFGFHKGYVSASARRGRACPPRQALQSLTLARHCELGAEEWRLSQSRLPAHAHERGQAHLAKLLGHQRPRSLCGSRDVMGPSAFSKMEIVRL